MDDLWSSEDCDPIKDIEAARALIKDTSSYKDTHDANELYFKLHYESILRNTVHEDYQLQVREMVDVELKGRDQVFQMNRFSQLLKIISNHPEFKNPKRS